MGIRDVFGTYAVGKASVLAREMVVAAKNRNMDAGLSALGRATMGSGRWLMGNGNIGYAAARVGAVGAMGYLGYSAAFRPHSTIGRYSRYGFGAAALAGAGYGGYMAYKNWPAISSGYSRLYNSIGPSSRGIYNRLFDRAGRFV